MNVDKRSDHNAIPHIQKPRIQFDDPDTYSTPRERYVKELINSAVEFGTLQMPADAPPPMDRGSTHVAEIDLVMHPQLGLLVCGSVFADGGETLTRRLDDQYEICELHRSILHRALQTNDEVLGECPAPGIFIALPQSTPQNLPRDWTRDRTWLGANDDSCNLAQQILGAMNRADMDSYQDWPRVMAIIQGSSGPDWNYTSALQWLMIFHSI